MAGSGREFNDGPLKWQDDGIQEGRADAGLIASRRLNLTRINFIKRHPELLKLFAKPRRPSVMGRKKPGLSAKNSGRSWNKAARPGRSFLLLPFERRATPKELSLPVYRIYPLLFRVSFGCRKPGQCDASVPYTPLS